MPRLRAMRPVRRELGVHFSEDAEGSLVVEGPTAAVAFTTPDVCSARAKLSNCRLDARVRNMVWPEVDTLDASRREATRTRGRSSVPNLLHGYQRQAAGANCVLQYQLARTSWPTARSCRLAGADVARFELPGARTTRTGHYRGRLPRAPSVASGMYDIFILN
jgi:hypothetical protein